MKMEICSLEAWLAPKEKQINSYWILCAKNTCIINTADDSNSPQRLEEFQKQYCFPDQICSEAPKKSRRSISQEVSLNK